MKIIEQNGVVECDKIMNLSSLPADTTKLAIRVRKQQCQTENEIIKQKFPLFFFQMTCITLS